MYRPSLSVLLNRWCLHVSLTFSQDLDYGAFHSMCLGCDHALLIFAAGPLITEPDLFKVVSVTVSAGFEAPRILSGQAYRQSVLARFSLILLYVHLESSAWYALTWQQSVNWASNSPYLVDCESLVKLTCDEISLTFYALSYTAHSLAFLSRSFRWFSILNQVVVVVRGIRAWWFIFPQTILSTFLQQVPRHLTVLAPLITTTALGQRVAFRVIIVAELRLEKRLHNMRWPGVWQIAFKSFVGKYLPNQTH